MLISMLTADGRTQKMTLPAATCSASCMIAMIACALQLVRCVAAVQSWPAVLTVLQMVPNRTQWDHVQAKHLAQGRMFMRLGQGIIACKNPDHGSLHTTER
jgi:hypothetical protein